MLQFIVLFTFLQLKGPKAEVDEHPDPALGAMAKVFSVARSNVLVLR